VDPQTPSELRDIIVAERATKPFLVWRTQDGEQRILLLDSDRWRMTIGRDESADVSLAWDAEVSRVHALLEQAGRGWTLIDDGLSRNGSFVNGARVFGRCRLGDKDRLCFGMTEITYREPTVAVTATASVGGTPLAIPLSPTQRKVVIALCRPLHSSESATPATNREIADEVCLSVAAVKAHLQALFGRFGLTDLPQNEKRARLAATALTSGVLAPRDF
jgi:hypothetical protein